MWRTALRPRWLALLAVVLAAVSAMAWLGSWQLDRARQLGVDAQRERLAEDPVALTSLFGPRERFPGEAAERPVSVDGRWEPDDQLLVPDRRRQGESGFWVLTPLRLDDGSVLAVVRGFTPSRSAAVGSAATLPGGVAEVSGVLLPGEPTDPRPPGQPAAVPAGELERIDPVELIEVWDGPLYTGFVVAVPPVGDGLLDVPLISDRSGLALQNLSYAVQWWIFAAFGLWLWFRLVRDDHRGMLHGPPPDVPDAPQDPQAQATGAPGRMAP